jgi:hydroxypyruvate isomerase
MPRFSAHLAFLWQELPFLGRITAASKAGFPAVECAMPGAPATEVRSRCEAHGIAFIGLNTSPGEERGGKLGFAALPGMEKEFARDLAAALDYAGAVGARHVHVLAGTPEGDREAAETIFLRNIETAIPMAERAGVTLVLEGLNTRDRPGYFLSRFDEALALVRRFHSPRLKAMFDSYHVQIMEGDVVARLEGGLGDIGHIQISGVPGRSEPDAGELDHRHVLAAIDRLGWPGYVGCEYRPRGTTEAGLGWMTALTR